jgi:hypothetical protein
MRLSYTYQLPYCFLLYDTYDLFVKKKEKKSGQE